MEAPLSLWKKLAFGLTVSSALLALCFGLLELGLRVAGFGHSTTFFHKERDAQGRVWWRENRWVTAPYFPPQLIRRPQSIRLPETKQPGTYRIFILGSSAAMGDPEPAFSLARQLNLILESAYPKIHFEVVNAGITAINSHVVRVLAADCAQLQPDLFIVYEGNNEVIGPYGPGTVFSPFLGSSAAIRAGRAIKSTRTGQLMAALARRFGSAKTDLGNWGGMQMFLKNEIDRDDPRLATTRTLFRENLQAIAAIGRKAGASVFLCTVLTNQKDFAPFISRHKFGFTDEEKQKWQACFDAARQAFSAGDDAVAEAKFREALAIDAHFAELQFRLGKLCLRENRVTEAKKFFQQALDLDTLRFRTDSRLNEVIRSLDSEPGVQVVDLVAAAEKLNAQGLIGDEFLYEHVHLNFQGTYLMARELFAHITAELVKTGKMTFADSTAEILTVSEMRHRLAYTVYEQAMLLNELQVRFSKAPFTLQSDNAARCKICAKRLEVANHLLAMPATKAELANLYEKALAASPEDWMLRRNAGMAFVGLGKAERALPLLEQALVMIPDDADTLFALATAQRQLGQEPKVAETFARLRELEPRYLGLPPTK